MGRTPASGGTAFRFTAGEIKAMENALDDAAGATPARSVVEGLAEQFTNSPDRVNQRAVSWKQVWNWFQNRRHAQKAKIEKSKAIASGVETPPAPKVVTVAGTSTAKKVDAPMDFEAKSARDGAWYDVSAFIDKRNLDTDLPEVKVRFAGFGSEEDEWVNITNAVRQRSLPCETTECVAVLPGDLILCFQEGSEQALYFDADILDVQRRRHDVRGCRCRFWVRYRHDQTEEVVPLRKVCRRPETEQRLQLAREGIAANKVGALGGTPNIRTPSQIPPTTPATPAQPSSAFNATPNLYMGTSSNLYTPVQQGTSTPGLHPMQPIPIQSMSTPITNPDARPSIHQQAVPSSAASIHSTSVLQGAAVSPSPGPAASAQIGNQNTATQQVAMLASAQQSLPSIESSITRQLNITAPVQQVPTSNAGGEPSMSGTAQQEPTAGTPLVDPTVSGVHVQLTLASTEAAEPSNSSQPMGNLEIAKPSAPGPASTANVGAAQTSTLTQSMGGVSLTPAVDAARPSSAAQVNPSDSSAADVPLTTEKISVNLDLSSTPVDETTRVGDAAVAPVTAPESTLPV
ncbi:hypothetical protein KC19_3G188900 [Ceratodon purpureus]|uniref:Homeobox domain-containing protein n=1 Tax=Ceratodon purpureus TaxID=3225 RepID=A0A8T0IM98_CERPU|nr:hypothetical protein KC19_3G188900 [Ceratodon purpureus]